MHESVVLILQLGCLHLPLSLSPLPASKALSAPELTLLSVPLQNTVEYLAESGRVVTAALPSETPHTVRVCVQQTPAGPQEYKFWPWRASQLQDKMNNKRSTDEMERRRANSKDNVHRAWLSASFIKIVLIKSLLWAGFQAHALTVSYTEIQPVPFYVHALFHVPLALTGLVICLAAFAMNPPRDPLIVAALEQIPCERYDGGDEKKECAVCLEEYTRGCELRRLCCGHRFHKRCLDPWLYEARSCPICRCVVSRCI